MKIFANAVETIQIGELLRKVCLPNGNGTCRYEPDWTDARVAAEAAPRLSSLHVRRIRHDLLGDLEPIAKQSLEDRLTALERQFSELRARLGE